MSTPFEDYKAIKSALEADLRLAWGFAPGDKVYQVPIEAPTASRGERYACVYLAEPLDFDVATVGHATALHQSTVKVAVRGYFERTISDMSDDAGAELALKLRNQVNRTHPYAAVASGHLCKTLDWNSGDPSDKRLVVEAVFEFTLFLERYIDWP